MSEAKEMQGYTNELSMCGNCSNFMSDKEPLGWNTTYFNEANLRCGLGGFRVNKTATCKNHSPIGDGMRK